MTMEWVTGVKLTTLPSDEIRDLVGVGQEAFLVQLLEVGFFHGDPHPGNLLKVGVPAQAHSRTAAAMKMIVITRWLVAAVMADAALLAVACVALVLADTNVVSL